MSLLFAFLLSMLPLGTIIYDWHTEPLDIGFKAKAITLYQTCFVQDSTVLPIPTLDKKATYRKTKEGIRSQQKTFQTAYKNARTEEEKAVIRTRAQHYITKALVNDLFPYWYGTTWSFDGYSAVPNEGSIGCSYFVSTTLLHAGFNLNRYRLAQQGPVAEAQSLSLGEELILIQLTEGNKDFANIMKAKCKEGLYFIGLGHSHVGYLYYREGECYFIQSSYGKSGQVEIDYARDSDILTGFSEFVLTPITTNVALINAWLESTEISIIKGTE
ncbi:hypothetical protein [Aureispira sp. CCB-QB1]|uniref:hypothetical protein n=1 Tax=Aureispira sp. CCB-QB1 TaxID=1313421 RepID=UPI000695B629|nr:hypothetical protein [Aureispira sp. CCB-QB1]